MRSILKPQSVPLIYCFLLLVTLNLAITGIFGVPFQWILTHQMKLSPEQTSVFGLISDTPAWVGFLFGFFRDQVRPKGLGDRGYFIYGSIVLAIVYVLIAHSTNSYAAILGISTVKIIVGCVLGAAANGLVASISKWNGLTGRVGAMTIFTASILRIVSSSAGGKLDSQYGHQVPFYVSSLLCLPLLAFAFWRPKEVFDEERALEIKFIPENALEAIRRLLRHKPIYLPALAAAFWAFAPGWGTPLFFF